ncbi:MAG TPA: malto-oligosyltrehalose synthase [Methylomirabilota bacterium]|jgi:(1->4)-alpha-D-glucan 1-alpha-D-glucosylmutase|nr:malto-oligosyltrehalose synthase [Methylomirabilota bacterium]
MTAEGVAAGPGDAPEARVPGATYRLQFHHGFRFDDARQVVPYLHALGITDLYASSYLTARPGSTHGYDVVDHTRLNPEIGSEADYRALVAELRAHDMGQLLDVVPNHMGIGGGANRWWNDVLENGRSSPYAEYFDIDWEPVRPELADRVLLPILGDQYGRVLENQELVLEYQAGAFVVRYHETRFPVAPCSTVPILAASEDAVAAALGDADPRVQEYRSILTALRNLPGRTETARDRVQERLREKEVIRRRLAELVDGCPPVQAAIAHTLETYNGKAGDARSFDLLDALLAEQSYRLCHWRVAADEINYRRFFDINDLAAIRIEHPAVFRATHQLVLGLVADGSVTGLRIDHPDGLYDPRGYFAALQRERVAQLAAVDGPGAGAGPGDGDPAARVERFVTRCDPDPAGPGCRPLYVVAEKILGQGERLPPVWAVHGTTGYEFMNLVGGLFVDRTSERAMTALYGAFTGRRAPFSDLVYEAKQLILEVSMSSELSMLGHALDRLSQRSRYSRDFTLHSLTRVLREVIACFPVYRSYIDGRSVEIALQDRACVEVAVAFAKRRNPAISPSGFDFVRDTLLLRAPEQADDAHRAAQLAFVQRFQQLTAPVTAKGVEDTAFYRYHRLVSLNEVGGDPDRFGIGVEEFHRQCAARQAHWPGGLSATATHDAKRGEDVRARIHVLSELPRAWRAAVTRWHRWNRAHATRVDGVPAPDPNDEYLFYQTLVGAWPLEPAAGGEPTGAFRDRIEQYMLKAVREAKVHTSWINANEAYETALRSFVGRTLDRTTAGAFLADFEAFQRPVARLGMVNGLAQVLLKLTAPGVPDFYQGTELWDLNLVDPDNRRPVDFARRAALLAELEARVAGGDLAGLAGELLAAWPDGRVKLYLIRRGLACRRAAPDLFRAGAYVPLTAVGPAAAHVCAFGRSLDEAAVLTVVPRLVAALTGAGHELPLGPACWGDTVIELPASVGRRAYRDLLTGAILEAGGSGGRRVLRVADVLARFPVALLEPAGAREG